MSVRSSRCIAERFRINQSVCVRADHPYARLLNCAPTDYCWVSTFVTRHCCWRFGVLRPALIPVVNGMAAPRCLRSNNIYYGALLSLYYYSRGDNCHVCGYYCGEIISVVYICGYFGSRVGRLFIFNVNNRCVWISRSTHSSHSCGALS